jgi:hypothetical protein
VHELGRADDGVDRAGIAAMKAADAVGFVNDGNGPGHGCDERQRIPAEKASEATNRLVAAGRAKIDGCGTVDDGLRVWAATGVATLRALRLRQEFIDLFDEIILASWQALPGDCENDSRNQRHSRYCRYRGDHSSGPRHAGKSHESQ